MFRKYLWLMRLGGVVLAAVAASGQEFKLGSMISDFGLQDLKGKKVGFSQLRGDVTAIVFVGTECEVSNDYNERMKNLYKDYSAKGVHFIFVNSNRSESVADVAAHATAHLYPFPVYKDVGNVLVADRFGAQVTPEAFVIDRAGTIRYHGSIDDSRKLEQVQNHWLRTALDAVMAGNQVAKPQTKAFGCIIQRTKAGL